MPGLNSWWEKYGCDTCDFYQLLVIDLNVKPADTKEGFVEYCTTNNVKYPAVWSGEGGRDLADAMGLGVSANSKYLIKPDRTKIGSVYEGTLSKEGIIEHNCDPVYTDHKITPYDNIGVVKTGNAISFSNFNEQSKYLKLFDLQGKMLWSKNLSKESSVAILPDGLCKGTKILSISGVNKTVTKTMIFSK